MKAESNTHCYYIQHYYPFGMLMPGRGNTPAQSYRYGFNGKEMDNEVKGNGNSLDFGGRIYDSRLGRFLSVDPSSTKYPGITPYSFTFNNPLSFNDPTGRDGRLTVTKNETGGGTITLSSIVYLYGAKASDVQAEEMTTAFKGLGNEYNYIDADGNNWTVKIDMKFVYKEQLKASSDVMGYRSIDELSQATKDEIGYQKGDNILYMGFDEKVANSGYLGEAWSNAAVFLGTSPAQSTHEPFHLLGFLDRYEGGSIETPGFNGDIMDRNMQDHIDPIHFINIVEEYLKNKEGYGEFANFSSGTRTAVVSGGGEFDYEEFKMTKEQRSSYVKDKTSEQTTRKENKDSK